MRADIVKVYKSLHTWTGLIAGMALFIAFFAGALTMFKEPLDRWASPPQVEAYRYRVDVSQLPQLIQMTLQQHPKAIDAFTIHIEPKENSPASLTWEEPFEDADEHEHSHYFIHDRHFWSGLDSAGNLVTGEYRPSEMAALIDILHQTAGIPGEGHHLWGVYVMGAVSVLYALALVSGLIILLPTLMKDLLAMRPGKNIKRFWLDAHNVVGFVSLPFHLVIAFTVVVFAFHDFLYDGLQTAVYGDRPIFPRERPAPVERDLAHLKSPRELLQSLSAIDKEFVVQEMQFSDVAGGGASVRAAGITEGQLMRAGARGLAMVDPYTGAITDTTYMPGQNQSWAGIVISFFALHFGNFGGDFVRWLYFFMGLAGGFLFYSGNLLWIESRRRKQKRGVMPQSQRRSTQLMAAATVGVCWGSVAGVASAMVAGKWLSATFENLTPVYMTTYYLVFVGTVSWAFHQGAARALIHLLWLCSMTALAIPVTGLLAILLPQSPLWVHARAETLAVEGVALLVGMTFIYAARKAAHRAYEGDADSVWYHQRRDDTAAAVELDLPQSKS